MKRKQWLADRRNGIGASEAAAVLGLSPWQSRYALWAEKTGMVEPVDDPAMEERFMVGKLMEPIIAKLFTRKTGIKVWRNTRNAIVRNTDYPWMFATLDGITASGVSPGEVWEAKTADAWTAAKWRGGVPEEIWIQVQHQMACQYTTGAWVAAFRNLTVEAFRVERDEEFIRDLIAREREFWTLVETKTPPEIDGHDATTEILKRRPQEDQDIIALPFEAAEKHCTRRRLSAEMKERKDECDAIDNRFRDWIDTHKGGWLIDPVTGKRTQYTLTEIAGREWLEVPPGYAPVLTEQRVEFVEKQRKGTRKLNPPKEGAK